MHIKKRHIPEALEQAAALLGQRALKDARTILTAIVKSDTRHAEALHLLGLLDLQLGKLSEAENWLNRAIRNNPKSAEYHNSLGVVLRKLGRFSEAERCYQRCLKLVPEHLEALDNLGTLLRHAKRPLEAAQYCRQAVKSRPDNLKLQANLAGALVEQGLVTEPRQIYSRLTENADNHIKILGLIGLMAIARSVGDAKTYCDLHYQVLQLEPGYKLGDYLFYLNYLDAIDQVEIARQHCDLATWFKPSGDVWPIDAFCCRQHRQQLRVGYISPDLIQSSVGMLFEPVIGCHDHEQFFTVVYDVHMAEAEPLEGIEKACDLWRNCRGMTDSELLALIRADKIDILVDLAGYCGNRLSVFAARAAPVQVSWLGYFNTTGLATMDWIISDHFSTPKGQEIYYSEKIWHMPYFRYPIVLNRNYRPQDVHLKESGEVIFCSNNNLLKLTEPLLKSWAIILRQLPKSRLEIRWETLASDEVRQAFKVRYQQAGGNLDQLMLLEPISDYDTFMSTYEKVDIMLDSYPFGGGVTSFEAIAMGVPVITLSSDRMAGQQSRAFLELSGHGELVADTWEHYIKIAVELANDPQRLQQLRSTIRPDLQNSPLCNVAQFTNDLETAYQRMWDLSFGMSESSLPGESP